MSIEPVRHDLGDAAFFMTCEIEFITKNSTMSFWCSTRPSADTGTDYYLLHYHYQEEEDEDKEEEVKEPQCAHPPPLDNDDVIDSNHCLCVPKAELNTENSTKRRLSCCLVEFLVFNSIH